MTLSLFLGRFQRNTSGLALLEFAFCFPILLLTLLGGAELAHYTITRMKVSQIALHIADNAARMGNGPKMAAKSITEADVADVFIGGHIQGGKLNLQGNARVILSGVEPTATPNTAGTYKIAWQRCYGDRTHPSSFGIAGQTGMPGVGPAGQLVTAQDDNATMFVEVFYVYTPIVGIAHAASSTMVETASMPGRDRRNLSEGILPANGAPSTAC